MAKHDQECRGHLVERRRGSLSANSTATKTTYAITSAKNLRRRCTQAGMHLNRWGCEFLRV